MKTVQLKTKRYDVSFCFINFNIMKIETHPFVIFMGIAAALSILLAVSVIVTQPL